MEHTPIAGNFLYPNVLPQHYRLGAILNKKVLRPDGDWRPFLPPEEDQNKRGIESSACYIEGQQHSIATLEENSFLERDNNYSARFNALLSNGTETGGDPLAGADSIRNDGLISESLMPFGDDIQSWDDFHSWKDVSEQGARLKGQEYRGKKKLNNEIVFELHESLATKYSKLREALKYSPCPMSVTAWFEVDGGYYKPEGSVDNHLVEAVYVDDKNCIFVRDTYAPYLKKLVPDFNPDFCMSWTVEKRTVPLEQEGKLILLYRSLIAVLTKIRDILNT